VSQRAVKMGTAVGRGRTRAGRRAGEAASAPRLVIAQTRGSAAQPIIGAAIWSTGGGAIIATSRTLEEATSVSGARSPIVAAAADAGTDMPTTAVAGIAEKTAGESGGIEMAAVTASATARAIPELPDAGSILVAGRGGVPDRSRPDAGVEPRTEVSRPATGDAQRRIVIRYEIHGSGAEQGLHALGDLGSLDRVFTQRDV
jgi:hypothetical protein